MNRAQPSMCNLRVCLYGCRLSRFFNWALNLARCIPLSGLRGFLLLRFVQSKLIHSRTCLKGKPAWGEVYGCSLHQCKLHELQLQEERQQTIFFNFIYSWKNTFFILYLFFSGVVSPVLCIFTVLNICQNWPIFKYWCKSQSQTKELKLLLKCCISRK